MLATTPRRSQPERRAATRLALLDATLETLALRGPAGTTTPEICRCAGLSQGALFKHFETKTALIAAAAEHLFARLIEDVRATLALVAGEGDRVRAAIERLDALFREPLMDIAIDLYAASRTDPELAARLAPVVHRHGENVLDAARELFPEAAGRVADFEATVGLVLSTLQGTALGRHAHEDAARDAAVRRLLTALVHTRLETP